MTADLDAVAAATAVVRMAERPVGSAVLVDGRHLLTAAHVLSGRGDGVEVLFPFVLTGTKEASAPVRPLLLDAGAIDIAVLDIGEASPTWLPPPVSLLAASRLPRQVSVFGFPLAEAAPQGVWREFGVSGPAGELVQLDWSGGQGTLRGHSGGPVVDRDTGALVGVLVQGSKRGQFDRFVPLSVVRRMWPDLPRPWLMAGVGARDHFTRRAYGQRSRARGGDLFRGRTAALGAVRSWLRSREAPGRVLVVTGQPGAGKSAVVARVVLQLEPERVGTGLAFHARGATLTDLLTAANDLLGLHADSADALIDAAGRLSDDEPWLIVVDALDETATASDRRQMAEMLAELAALPGLRVVVATRALAGGRKDAPSDLLRVLGVVSAASGNLVDLDIDRYFDPAGLRAFAAALLAQQGPPGAAWERYRSDAGLCTRLAGIIASRAGRNHLVAALAAVPLSLAEETIEPDHREFDPARIPSGVGEALGKYLETLTDQERVRSRALLTALAYARGDGVDDRMWLQFAEALGYQAATEDLDRLRESSAADYLLQTVAGNAGPVTRLYHQALVDELLAGRHRPSDERRLLETVLPSGECWIRARSYACTHAAEHAAAADELPRLIEDAAYLAVADLARLIPLLIPSTGWSTTARQIAVVIRRAGLRAAGLSSARRIRLLVLTAAHLGYGRIADRLRPTCDEGFVPQWAHGLGTGHLELASHSEGVTAVVLGRVGEREVIVSGSYDRTVRVWDAASGEQLGEPLTGHSDWVRAVALGRVGEREVIVSGSRDGTVRMWDAASGQQLGGPLTGHSKWVSAVALGRVGEREVIVSGGQDGTVRVWDAASGQQLGGPLTGHSDDVNAVALGRVGEREVIVSGSDDRTVRVWDAASGQQLGGPLTGHSDDVNAVALGRVGEREVIVSGDEDGTVQVWDAASGQQLGEPLTGHSDAVRAVALGRVGEREVIVSGSDDRTVRVWDAASGQQLGEPLIGHTLWVTAVALGRVGERQIIVSSSDDGSVRVWDVSGQQLGEPLTGHSDVVNAVVLGRVGRREVIVSGSDDRTVRVWDVASGRQLGEVLAGHRGWVSAVALGPVGKREVIVSCSPEDQSVRMWNAASRKQIGKPVAGYYSGVRTVALGRVGEREVIVFGSDDGAVRVRDAASGQQLGEPLIRHSRWVRAVAMGRIGEREVIVSGGIDGTVRVWDAASGQQLGEPLWGHFDVVNSVALGRVGEREVIVSGSDDRTVRVWDAASGQQLGEPLTGHSDVVSAVALGRVGGREVIVSASHDRTVRIWNLMQPSSLTLDFLEPVSAFSLVESKALVVATGSALVLLTP